MTATKRRAFGSIKRKPPRRGYYVRFRHEGREYERAGGPTRALAAAKLASVHSLLASGKRMQEVLAAVFGDSVGPNVNLRAALPDYLQYAERRKRPSTLASDIPRLNVMAKQAWAKVPLRRVRREDIQRFADQLHAKGIRSGRPCSAATVNRYLASLSALFRWAERLGLVDGNPVKGVERFSEQGRARELYLAAPEARALVRVASEALRPVLAFALGTGCRRGEILTLRWRDVDLAKSEIYVRAEHAKTKRGRPVPLPPDVVRILEGVQSSQTLRRLDRSDAVFQTGAGDPLTKRVLRRHFLEAVAACGDLPTEKKGVRFHDLRHTYASLALQSGVPLASVSRILGHTCLQTTMRYAHWCPDDRREAAQRVGKALALLG